MKKTLKRICIALGILILLFVIVGLLLPTEYEVSRSIVINAPRQRVHELVSDLTLWPQWEPWSDEDPTIKTTLGDKTAGVGAHQSWTGDSGKGELAFTLADPNEGVAYDLLFDDRYECLAGMSHEQVGDSVKVTWWMQGDTGTPVIGGYIARLMPGMIRPMFDRGLENLKMAAESTSPPPSE